MTNQTLADMVRAGKPISELQQLLHAEEYTPGHGVRIRRDLILAVATGMPLAEALKRAFDAGYAASDDEIEASKRRTEPLEPNVQWLARQCLLGSPSARHREIAAKDWRWQECGWVAPDDDFMVKPSDKFSQYEAVIVLEAGCEYAGEVVISLDSKQSIVAHFGDGTFR